MKATIYGTKTTT